MQKFKALIPAQVFILLALFSISGGAFSYLIFPATAFLLWFLVEDVQFRPEMRTAIGGFSLFLVFLLWHLIQYNKTPFLFALIFTFAIMAAFEGWRFTAYVHSNVWGLMNFVVFWVAMEYLMLLWLPFDISGWLIGTPLLNNEAANNWVIYSGALGFSLWVLLGGLLLYKSIINKKINFIALLAALLLIFLPVALSPGINDNESYIAQGEWIGRTCLWVSVLILIYTFVKRQTTKR
jgi:hypothetical protein